MRTSVDGSETWWCRSEALRSLAEALSDVAVAMLDPEGRVLAWSAAARALHGHDEAAVVGESFARLYAPEDMLRRDTRELLVRAAEDGRAEDERWCVRQDGSSFWARVVLSPVRDDGGRLLGFVHVSRDTTGAQDPEDPSRLIIASVKDYAIFMLDAEGRIASWNPGAERTKGYRADEIVGKHISVFYTPQDQARQRPAQLLRLAALEGRVEDEGWRVRKDGSRFWADVVITRVQDASGRLVGFAKVTRDLTARKEAEEQSAARTRQAAAVSEIGLFALETRDLDAVMERAARVVATTLGSDMADVLELDPDGSGFVVRAAAGFARGVVGARLPAGSASQAGFTLQASGCITPDCLSERRFSFPQLLAQHAVRSGMGVVILASSHGERPYGVLEAHARVPRSFSQDDLHFLQNVANVLAAGIVRRRAEEERRVAEAQAEIERVRTAEARSAVQVREDLIAIAAHELRTPLMALRLNLQSVERALKSAADATAEPSSPLLRHRIEGGLRNTERIAHLIERLLDLPRIASGQFHLKLEDLDLAVLARDTVDAYREAALKAGSELRLHATESAVGSFDRSRMQEALENLLSNAIKYGQGHPIEVSVEPREATVKLVVADQGAGIAPEELDRIFERFQRAAATSGQPGLGLGLYVTRHIIAAHGGTITVSSTPGAGTTFTVELPRAQANAALGEPAAPREAIS